MQSIGKWIDVFQSCYQVLVMTVNDTAQDFTLSVSGKTGAKDAALLLAIRELKPMVQSFSGSDLDST